MAKTRAGDRVTMEDVAARAGVSQPTVSLVLGRNPEARVATDTRERVFRAAEELGYRPNLLARGLVRQRSFAVGVIVPDLSNPFFADVVSGTERVAAEEDYAVLLCETKHTPVERHLEALRGRLIDGVIADAVGGAAISEHERDGLNLVLIDEPSDRWPGVASDALGAGRLAGRHLLELGHERVAFLGPALPAHGFRFRERGFVRVMAEAGRELPSRWLRRVPPTAGGGRAGMRALLSGSPRPTAVFCANDLIAVGALKAALAAGLSIPDHMSIVGCDDIELTRLVTPELTTVEVPASELGARAARLLIRRLEGKGAPESSRPLPVHLQVRESTAPPPREAA